MNLREPSSDTRGFVDAVLAMPEPRPAVGRDYTIVRRPSTYKRAAWRDQRDAEIMELYRRGVKQVALASEFGLSPSAVSFIIKQNGRRA